MSQRRIYTLPLAMGARYQDLAAGECSDLRTARSQYEASEIERKFVQKMVSWIAGVHKRTYDHLDIATRSCCKLTSRTIQIVYTS